MADIAPISAPDGSPTAHLIDRLLLHYATIRNGTEPSQAAPDLTLGFDEAQRLLLARTLFARLFARSFDILSERRGFEMLADTPVSLNETSGPLRYQVVYTQARPKSGAPGAYLNLLLSEQPDSALSVNARLVAIVRPAIGLYLTIGYRSDGSGQLDSPLRELADLGARFGALLAHAYRSSAYAGFADVCAGSEQLSKVLKAQNAIQCDHDCRAALRELETRIRSAGTSDVAPAGPGHRNALLCAGLAALWPTVPPLDPPLAPDLVLSQGQVLDLWKAALSDKAYIALLIDLAASEQAHLSELVKGLDRAEISVVRAQVEPIIRKGPSRQALRLISVWVRLDERAAASALMDAYPVYSRKPAARRVLIDALAFNPDKTALAFLLERLNDETITAPALNALLLWTHPAREAALKTLSVRLHELEPELAQAALKWMIGELTRNNRQTVNLLLSAATRTQTATRSFDVYQSTRELLGRFNSADWKSPERLRDVDDFVSGDLSPSEMEPRLEALRDQLLDASPDAIVWLFDYARRLDGEARRRMRALLRALAAENETWNSELQRLARLTQSPKVASLAKEALGK
jgi:hypothetical protein